MNNTKIIQSEDFNIVRYHHICFSDKSTFFQLSYRAFDYLSHDLIPHSLKQLNITKLDLGLKATYKNELKLWIRNKGT